MTRQISKKVIIWDDVHSIGDNMDTVLFPNRESGALKFKWRATFRDGSTLDQDTNICSEKISRVNLVAFELLDADQAVMVVLFNEGDRFAFRTRNIINATGYNNPEGPQGGLKERYYIIMLERNNSSSYIFFEESTRKIIYKLDGEATNFGFFYPLELLENENETITIRTDSESGS